MYCGLSFSGLLLYWSLLSCSCIMADKHNMETTSTVEPIMGQIAKVSLQDEDNDDILVVKEGSSSDVPMDLRWAFVGRFLAEDSVKADLMKNTMASIWQLGRGVCIQDLNWESNLFLFQFGHEVDIRRILGGHDRVTLARWGC